MAFSQTAGATTITVPSGMADGLVGISAWARRIRHELRRAAATDATVLIHGPTGTGKELIANAVHAHSRRAAQSFVPVDCTSLSGDLFASQLFGHVRGAFTGAHCDALGAFRTAHGGTIFLDEIGELEPVKQIQLLRVLQQRAVVPVGGAQPIPVDVRIVAATNRHLGERIKAGQFREDLYYRLHVIELQTLALKDRREDIPVLVDHFLVGLCREHDVPLKRLTPPALALLREHHWPGNVRELRNVLERAVLYSPADVIDLGASRALLESAATAPVAALPTTAVPPPVSDATNLPAFTCPAALESQASYATGEPSHWRTLHELIRDHVQHALHYTSENQSAAARLLGITPRVLSRLLKKHGIELVNSRRGRPHKSPVPDSSPPRVPNPLLPPPT